MRTIISKISAALLALALAAPALGQQAAMKVNEPWYMMSKLSSAISVTGSSASTQLPTTGFTLWLCNIGSNDAYLKFGRDSTVTVTVANGSWLKAGTCATYDLYPFGAPSPLTYIALIGSGGTTSVYAEAGSGQPPTSLVSGGGGGGTVTQGTTPWVDSITTWAGGTLGAMANYGTSPGAVLVPGVNAFVTSLPPIVQSTSPWVTKDTNSDALLAAAQATTVPYSALVPNNTNGVSVKASAGFLYSAQLGGIGSVPAYLKLYDTASAPTCGSGTPVKRLIIPAAATSANGGGSNVSIPVGSTFVNGIGYCVTLGQADNDTTAPASGAYIVNLDTR